MLDGEGVRNSGLRKADCGLKRFRIAEGGRRIDNWNKIKIDEDGCGDTDGAGGG